MRLTSRADESRISDSTDGSSTPSRGVYYRSLDAWRGIAALWVVGTHSVGMVARDTPSIFQKPVERVLSYGIYGIEIFFVVSGFCIAVAVLSSVKRENPLGYFIQARLKRIFPTYWLSLVFIAVCTVVFSLMGGHLESLESEVLALYRLQPWQVYASNVTLTHMIWHHPSLTIVSWTLGYELGFYLICAIPLIIFIHRKDMILNALHGLTLLTATIMVVRYDILPFPLDLWVYFGLGVLLYDMLLNPRRKYLLGILGCVTVLLIVFAFRQAEWICNGGHEPKRSVFVALATTYLLGLLWSKDEVLSRLVPLKILMFIGTFSYSLYLIHYVVLGLAFGLTRDTLRHLPTGVTIVSAFLLSVGVAWLFYLLAEKPFLKKK